MVSTDLSDKLSSSIDGWIKETLSLEAEAILQKTSNLKGKFVDVIVKMASIKGKVVFTGMGKSGHIARKLAATFASTGTPSFYLHPAEAMHGDLGMISADDILFAIAFGGETAEVIEVAKHCKRQNISIVSLTGKPKSSLASLSCFVIDGSVEKEACPLNLAPTCSTTVALALGDAICVALMRYRGFEEQDFALYHPQGSLGRRLSLVEEHFISKDQIKLLQEDDDIHKVLEVITHKNLGIAIVTDKNDRVLGVISDGDLRRAMVSYEKKVFDLNSSQIMTKSPKTVKNTALAIEAFKKMEKNSITSLLVLGAQDEFLGIIKMHDLVNAKVI